MSKSDLDRVKTSHIIREGKWFVFSANLTKVEKYVDKKRKPIDINSYDEIRLLVDLSEPLGSQHSQRMSSTVKAFYSHKSNATLDPVEKLGNIFQTSAKKEVSLKIILGSSGVKELPRLKTHTSLLVPTRYKLKELEVCSVSQSKIGDVSVASIREV